MQSQTNSYSYNTDNRLTAIDGQTVTHNANGDLTGIGTNSYTYDFEDRLVQLSLTNIFTYDGLGNRLARTVRGQVRRFALDRMGTLTQVLVENDVNNSPVAYYVYGLGLAQRISSGGTVATYHFNLQGSTVAVTDLSGNVTDSYAYDSFGGLANSDGDSRQPFRYLGRYGIIDDSTGLLYARARYFSPPLGRFLTKDPVTGKDGDGQSLNRYVYALNNPLKLIDPTGRCASRIFASSTSDTSDQSHTLFLVSGSSLIDITDKILERFSVYLKLETHVDTQFGGLRIGELRLTPGSSIDLAGVSSLMKLGAKINALYGIYDITTSEWNSRGISLASFANDIWHAPQNIGFGLQHPNAFAQALDEGVASAIAATLKFETLGISPFSGSDIQQAFENAKGRGEVPLAGNGGFIFLPPTPTIY